MTNGPPVRAQAWKRRMVARDATAAHRASTNLELLFDLTFVVAVAAVARELAHSLVAGHFAHGVGAYVSVFFAIWWAWMNFTWFASAYDTDDVPYRLLTLVQMAGVLVLAAGVGSAFEHNQFTTVTVGYVIMRVAMVGQWLRAAVSDPEHRASCLRYASGIALIQVGWVIRLALPHSLGTASFIVMAGLEMIVPLVAERPGMTTWHPEHIAERYGLFTIIVLGEGVTQAAGAFQQSFSESGVSTELASTGAAALLLLFAAWWLYFVVPQGERLRSRPGVSFLWGYGHFFVFSSLAAVAAGLEVALDSLTHHVDISRAAVALCVAVPAAIFLVVYSLLNTLLTVPGAPPLPVVAVAAVATVLAAETARWWPIPAAGLLVTVPVVLLVGYTIFVAHRAAMVSVR